jgi:hypothetical protein
MGTITTLRPSATSSGVGWTATPSGSLHGVTSDDSDSTYALWSGSGSALILATPADAPPAGERRHQARLRMRGEDGDAWGAVRLASGGLVAGAAAQFSSSPGTITGAWGTGVPADGSTVMSAYVTGQTSGVKIEELYLDVDSRTAPDFTLSVLDGSGTPSTTISDTAQPTLSAGTPDLDDLTARQYRFWVTLNGATVWDTGVTSGPATNQQTAPLDNGTYVAHGQVWSTLGQNTAYASAEETVTFTISVGSVPSPENPEVSPVDGTPFYQVEVCAPYAGDFDGGQAYVEIQRVDCPQGGYLNLTGSGNSYASTPLPEVGTPAEVVSGEFEGDVTGWAPSGAALAYSTVHAYQGTGAALITTDGGVQAYIRPDGLAYSPTVVAGRTYRTTSRLYCASSLPEVAAAIDWFDADVNYLDTSYGSTALTAGTWVEVEVTGVAPVGAVYANYGPTVADSAPAGTQVWADHITFQDTSPPVDLEVTLFAQRSDNWYPAQEETLASHYDTTGNQRAWRLAIQEDGLPILGWSGDGTSTLTFAVSTERLPFDAYGRAWVRARLDSDDGTGNWVVTFWSSEDGATWTQVGDTLTGTGPAPLFASSADYYVGAYMAGSGPVNRWTGRIYSAEVRTTADGAVLASPDFTGRPAGTTSFADGEGNTWTVSSPASITSDQRITSVAVLGPLDTDECASFEDFSLPRTGQGVTCEHRPDPCCSYYRARTVGRVDGALQVSDWSDAYDPGIPNGMIFLWPSTAASIPAGWNRVAELDGKYAKGVASTGTQPGATGGAETHAHTVSTHTHDTSHTHTMSANTSAGVGSLQSGDGATGTTAILTTHTHTVPAATGGASSTASSGTAPAINDAGNNPDRLTVIHIESNGQPLGVPNGALGLAPDTSLSGWSDYADAAGRFLKGATGGTDGGGINGSQLNNHSHVINGHTHTGPTHTHSATTGSVSSDKSLFAGPNNVLWTGSHSHPITANSTSAASLSANSTANSGASSLGSTEPPFTNVRVKANTSGGDSLPVGIIGIWRGSLGSIPSHWELCDGTSGKPNLIGRYPKGATSSIGTTGGSVNPHNHTSPSHTHTTGTHSHTMTIGSAGAATAATQAVTTVTVSTGTHTHTHGDTAAATPTVGSSTSGTLANTTTEPPYEEVAFVQLVEEPTPPPAPEEFCLIWDEDEHLIRTTGPDGPLFVALGGQITWDRDRPFTSATGVMGSRFVTSSAPGGRNLHLTTAVESEAELAALQAVLSRPLVLVSPSDSAEVWAAPVTSSVKVIKIGRIRQVTADFIATGPQPAPQLADVG